MWLMWRKFDRPIQANCDGGRAVIPNVGMKQTGMQRGCCNRLTLREKGAPEEFIRQAPICKPEEIGK